MGFGRIGRMWFVLYLIFGISQLGGHFWPDWSFVYGIKIDYLSPTFYLTDLIWIGAVLGGIIGKRKQRFKKIDTLRFLQRNIGWIVLALINILVANRWQVSLYKWLRMWQFWWWVKYLGANKKMVLKMLPKIIGWWIGIEAILGLGQVVSGGSLGGVFYWLGERRFSYMTPGIARISWFGDSLVRAYGTFSHPNSLAGFLLVAVFLLNKIKGIKKDKIWMWMINWLAVMGIILAGSRAVWLAVVLIFTLKIRAKIGLKLIFFGITLMIGGLLFDNSLEWLGGWSSESLIMRMSLNRVGLEMVRESPLFGTGLNNFLVKLPDNLSGFWVMQPVHNIFLLALVELGLVGFLWLGLFLKKKIRWSKFGWIWVVIFLTGMFDHYWLSLPQNVFLLSVMMGLSLRN